MCVCMCCVGGAVTKKKNELLIQVFFFLSGLFMNMILLIIKTVYIDIWLRKKRRAVKLVSNTIDFFYRV